MAPQQIILSDLCENIITQYDNLIVGELKNEDGFWDSVHNFDVALRSYPEDVKTRLGIQVNIKELNDIFDATAVLRNKRKEALTIANEGDERKFYKQIISNYRELINKVEEIKKKAKFVEEQRFLDVGPGWAAVFLTKYYNVITAEGSLEDIMKLMEVQLSTMDEAMIKGSFTRQKTRLSTISRGIDYLKSVDGGFPEDLKQRVLTIETRIGNLVGLYSQNIGLNEKADQIIEVHETLKEELLHLYEETIKRSVFR